MSEFLILDNFLTGFRVTGKSQEQTPNNRAKSLDLPTIFSLITNGKTGKLYKHNITKENKAKSFRSEEPFNKREIEPKFSSKVKSLNSKTEMRERRL